MVKKQDTAVYDVTYTNRAGTLYKIVVPKVALAKFVKNIVRDGGTIVGKTLMR